MDNIGIRLKHIRERKGLSLRALGKASNTSHSFIADIEAGRSKPSIDTLMALARALGVSLVELTGDVAAEPPAVCRHKEAEPSQPNRSTPAWWHRDTPPDPVELEEFLRKANIHFNGAPLDEEDKRELIDYLRYRWWKKRKEQPEGGEQNGRAR